MFSGPVVSSFFPFAKGLGPSGVDRRYGEEQAVFVEVVELLEFPEQVIPTVVWFNLVENVDEWLPQVLYLSTKLGRLVFHQTPDYREINPLSSSTRSNELASGVVQSASEIVEDIPAQQLNVLRDAFNFSQVVHEEVSLRI